MLLGPYTLNVLVNGSPLPEFTQPLEGLKVPVSTEPSCVLDESTGQWHISDSIIWAKVQHPGSYFTVKFSSSYVSSMFPLMAYLVIDGQLDYRYIEMYNPGFYSRDHFISSDKSTKYYFKFNNTVWSKECQIGFNTNYGGLGAISMYFYRARPINEKVDVMPQFEIKQPILSEGNDPNDIKITTGFDTSLNNFGSTLPNMNYLESLYGVPVGILHLHYRSTSWFGNFPMNSLPVIQCDDLSYNFANNMMVQVNQETGYVSINQEFQFDGPVTIKKEPGNDEGSVMTNREPVTGRQENENISKYIEQGIQKEPISLIKVEPIA